SADLALEAGVLVVRAGEALTRRSLLDQTALQRLVFDGELVLGDEIAADEGDRLARQLRHALQRVERNRDDPPDVLEIAVAGVEEQQRQRDEAEESQPRQRRRPTMEERGRLDLDVAHRASAFCDGPGPVHAMVANASRP